jgi:excisionase family DNA binding protein
MKIVYIADDEELKALIRDSIKEEIGHILKDLYQKPIPERMNLPDAAQYLGVSKGRMYKYTHTRTIPFHKLGKRIFFYTKELDDWLKETAPRYKSRLEIEREASEYLSKAAKRGLNRI